LSGKGSEGDPK